MKESNSRLTHYSSESDPIIRDYSRSLLLRVKKPLLMEK